MVGTTTLAVASMFRCILPKSRTLLCSRLVRSFVVVEGESVKPLGLSSRSFSSPAAVKLPSNLTIDPRSSFAPKPASKVRVHPLPPLKESDEKDEEETTEVDTTAAVASEGEEADEEAFSEDDEAEDELYLSIPEVQYAKPLPDRLHVDVHTLFAPSYDSKVGTIWLDENVFGRDPIRVDLLKRAVNYYRNKLRGRRKAHAKTLADVSGSRRKRRPQKGQGMARMGHSRPPHHRGGGAAHGPKNLTDYGKTKLNKKVRKKALCHALSQRLLEGNLIVLDQLHALPSYKTKELAKLLDDWGLGGRDTRNRSSALILDSYVPEEDAKTPVTAHHGLPVPFYLAASNIPRITVGDDHKASVYQILRHDKLVLTLSAVEKLEERLKDVL